ncbi:MAG: polysaccharide biosynthesis/export family protein, partial [Candidatus Acidiferrales bacterium]
LASSMTVLDGLATAGGFKDFAKVNKIVILRTLSNGSRQRIPFQYKQAIKGGASGPAMQLMPGDTVIVP